MTLQGIEPFVCNTLAMQLHKTLDFCIHCYNSGAQALQYTDPVPSPKSETLILAQPQIAAYAARLASSLICIELLTHTLYFNAIARFGVPAAAGPPSGMESGMTGFWVLAFM